MLIRVSRWLSAFPVLIAVDTTRVPELSPSGQVTLRTDRSAYVAIPTLDYPPYLYTFALVAQLENRTTHPVEVKRSCTTEDPEAGPLYSVPSVNEDLDSDYTPVRMCAEERPTPVIAVPPGATRVDTLRVSGPHTWDGRTQQPMGVLAGRYRLTYELNSCRSVMDCDEVRSNEFEVRLGR